MGESTVQVDPSNREQLRAWDGDEGAYWAGHADHFDRSVAAYHDGLMAACRIEPAHRVLDVGCGAGQVALDAARLAVAGSVVGVDLSAALLDVARARAAAAGVHNVAFEQADAQVHRFEPAAYDVVVSRTGAMFFGDRAAAFRNLASSTRPGGRLLLLTWQPFEENEWLASFAGALTGSVPSAPPPDAPTPFSLSDPDRVRSLLGDAGFRDVTADAVAAPMWFGDDADDALGFVSGLLGWMVAGLDDAGRRAAIERLRADLAGHATPAGVTYRSAAWIFAATRSA